MLARLGVDSISLNGFNDAKLSPRSPSEIQKHLDNLQSIVKTLHYDMGVLFTNEGERLTVVDSEGRTLSGNTLMGVIGLLTGKTIKEASVCLTVTAPSKLEEALKGQGVDVIRSKADTPSLMNTALDAGVDFAGDDHGGFIFPEFHPGYDASFALAKLISMLQDSEMTLKEVAASVPHFQLAYEQVNCSWDQKGKVMRRISEDQSDETRIELLDGIKIYSPEGWVLVLPDAVEPMFHVYAESENETGSQEMVSDFAQKIQSLAAMK